MIVDPQLNPLIVVPVLAVLALLFLIVWWKRMDGRLQWAVLLAIGFVVVVFFLSRTPLL